MELGIILRHDPLTLGSRFVENIEVRGAFVQSPRTTVKGEGKNGLKVRSAEHATKVRLEAVWEVKFIIRSLS
jgi:hypothetical protein